MNKKELEQKTLIMLKEDFNILEISKMLGLSRSMVHRAIMHNQEYQTVYKNRKTAESKIFKILNCYKNLDKNNKEVKSIKDICNKFQISSAFLYKLLIKYNIPKKNKIGNGCKKS